MDTIFCIEWCIVLFCVAVGVMKNKDSFFSEIWRNKMGQWRGWCPCVWYIKKPPEGGCQYEGHDRSQNRQLNLTIKPDWHHKDKISLIKTSDYGRRIVLNYLNRSHKSREIWIIQGKRLRRYVKNNRLWFASQAAEVPGCLATVIPRSTTNIRIIFFKAIHYGRKKRRKLIKEELEKIRRWVFIALRTSQLEVIAPFWMSLQTYE